MIQQRCQQGPTTGRYLWLVMAVAVGLALGTQAAAAKDCHRGTPLPADVRLITPGPEVPAALARFAGAWMGAWLDQGKEALCHTLVVEEVLANGYARVILGHGSSADWDVGLPNFWYITGRIIDGALHVRVPGRGGPKLAYGFAGETLHGTSEGPDGGTARVSLTRLADLSQVGCGPEAGGLPPAPPATGPRDRLTAAELLAPAEVGPEPVHNAYFLPVGQAAPALHAFKGTFTLQASTMLRARHGCPGLPEPLPGFTVAFFTHGEHLVPVVSDIVRPNAILVSPGRVWSEPGDGGMSRASFPFVLIERLVTRNGLATFLYDDTRVSALRWQVVQENNPWGDRYDGWGQAPLTYTPSPLPHEDAVRARFTAALQQQMPIHPWPALPIPIGAPGFEGFDGDTAPDELKASGVIVDGVVYLRGCETRWGPYPYCRQMRHGVFSATKSLGAAVALFRLAQTHGDQVFALKIKDYVTVTAAHDGWEQVTFADALNMATGIGDGSPQRDPSSDENSPNMGKWGEARTAKEKLDASFAFGKYPWGPGEVFRYNSSHTVVLGAAMYGFLKRQAGPQAHLWERVAEEVFRPIGLFQAPMLHWPGAEGEPGLPHLSGGFYLTIDDVAKLATLLHNGGRHQGQQLLSAAKLAEALYQTKAMGLPTLLQNWFGVGRYHLSFWSVPYRTATGCVFQIPFASGRGGNVMVLLPNGITAFRFADGGHFDVSAMVLAGEAIYPFPCPADAGEAPPPEPQPLTAGELRAELAGHTFYAGPLNFFVAPDGVLYGTYTSEPDGGKEHDIGRWYIVSDRYFCWKWHAWDGRREGCATMSRERETFVFSPKDRFETEVFRRVPGNPQGY
jgi:Beta-lactamase